MREQVAQFPEPAPIWWGPPREQLRVEEGRCVGIWVSLVCWCELRGQLLCSGLAGVPSSQEMEFEGVGALA